MKDHLHTAALAALILLALALIGGEIEDWYARTHPESCSECK